MTSTTLSINDINNNQLSGIKASPLKDSTSDGQSSFEMGRQVYARTLPYNPNTAPSTSTTYNWHVRQNVQQTTTLPTGNSSQYMNGKKWYGNRDASQIIRNRRTSQIGMGSLNASGNVMSYTSNIEKNSVQDALRRVRGGGAVAPEKKNANLNNAPTPSFAPIQNKGIYGLRNPTMFH